MPITKACAIIIVYYATGAAQIDIYNIH